MEKIVYNLKRWFFEGNLKHRPFTGGGRDITWQKSELRKASLLTAHFVALSVQQPVPASSPSFVRENTTKSPV